MLVGDPFRAIGSDGSNPRVPFDLVELIEAQLTAL
ncbi:MAG: hypothetical protein QOE93_638 [Actinomycetota bacterium]|jgi:hypothetical protein|nr:hypothetical protein [Actinomycetota bacterium]